MAQAITVLLVLLIISPAAFAVTYTVGDTRGWTTGFDYTTWAAGKTFTTDDSLLFTYGPSHTVDEVNQADYLSCSTTSPISSSATSPTTIDLTEAGTRYFICVTNGHCARGQKLAVTVTAASATPASPPPPAGGAAPSPPTRTPTTPATPTTPTTPATPGTPPRTGSAPPPPSGGAAAALSGRSTGLVAGLSVVLVAVFGLMG
ncbi:hypothetical protein ABFS82_02G140500 [Erythranthe guttata]